MKNLLTCLVLFITAPAFANTDTPVTAPEVTSAAATQSPADAPVSCCRLPAGTPIDLEILDPLNSSQRKRGDRFALRVTVPVIVDGVTVVPAGTTGHGEIVHAAAARGGGAPGELLIAARALDLNGTPVRLRGLKVSGTGQDNSALALGMSTAIGAFAMFIRGREIEIPASTEVQAKVAEDVVLPQASTTGSISPTE